MRIDRSNLYAELTQQLSVLWEITPIYFLLRMTRGTSWHVQLSILLSLTCSQHEWLLRRDCWVLEVNKLSPNVPLHILDKLYSTKSGLSIATAEIRSAQESTGLGFLLSYLSNWAFYEKLHQFISCSAWRDVQVGIFSWAFCWVWHVLSTSDCWDVNAESWK